MDRSADKDDDDFGLPYEYSGHESWIYVFNDECKENGIALLPPDVNHSAAGFTVEEGGIRFGLAAIKGIGRALIARMTAEREKNGLFADFQDFCRRMDGTDMNKRAVEGLIRAGAFEEDYVFTYVFVRGPVNLVLSDANAPDLKTVLTVGGEIVSSGSESEQFADTAVPAPAKQYYMERIDDTSVVAVPRDADFVIGWEAQESGTVEVRFADCSVHASASYHGAGAAPQRVKQGDAGTAYRSEAGADVLLDGFEPADFTAAEIAAFMGVDSVGVNWRISLMLLAALAGIVVTVLIWIGLLLNRTPKKPGVPVWMCLGVFCIAMLEAELAFWFFADHTNLRMLWKMILGAALLVIFLLRHWKSKRTLLMLPGFFMLIAADVVMCLYVLQGAILFTVAHALLIIAFLYRSPMPLKMWIQWFVVSAIASVLIVFGFIRKIGTLAWGAAAYAVVLLLLNYAAGGQLPRARFAARLFLLSEAILLIFMTVFNEPILHILSVLMFDTALLLIAVSKTGVEQPNEPASSKKRSGRRTDSSAPEETPPIPQKA